MADLQVPGWEKAYRTPRMKAEHEEAKARRAANRACHGDNRPCDHTDGLPASIGVHLSFLGKGN